MGEFINKLSDNQLSSSENKVNYRYIMNIDDKKQIKIRVEINETGKKDNKKLVCGKERLNKISQEKILRQTQIVIVLLSLHPSIRVSRALCALVGTSQ